MSLSENLRKYLETTPREKVLEDWAKTERFYCNDDGPTADDFLQYVNNVEFDIRKSDTIKKYNEAKKIVYQYELEYNKALSSDELECDIWGLRYEIAYRFERLKENIKSGWLKEKNMKLHPYYKQIENRRKRIVELLKIKYEKRKKSKNDC